MMLNAVKIKRTKGLSSQSRSMLKVETSQFHVFLSFANTDTSRGEGQFKISLEDFTRMALFVELDSAPIESRK